MAISILSFSLFLLLVMPYSSNSFALIDCQASPFDCDAPISDLAYDIAEIHKEKAQLEMAKTPPNMSGAELHENLAGLSTQELSRMGGAGNVTLSPENEQKLNEAGMENCYIASNTTVICFT